MGNRFEELKHELERGGAEPAPALAPAAPVSGGNRFEQLRSDLAGGAPPAPKPGKTFGELRAADPTPTERWVTHPTQDLFMKMGADPYNAGWMARGVTFAANATPVMGHVLAAHDLKHDLERGNWLAAGANAVGMVAPPLRMAKRWWHGMPRYTPPVPKDQLTQELREKATDAMRGHTPVADAIMKNPALATASGGFGAHLGPKLGLDAVTGAMIGAGIPATVGWTARKVETPFRMMQARAVADRVRRTQPDYQQLLANTPDRYSRPAMASDAFQYLALPNLREPARAIDDYGHTPYDER